MTGRWLDRWRKSATSASAASGAVPSFEVIYERYFDFVWASVRRLGVGSDSLDDVVQEVFIVIHSRLHTLEQPDSLRSWIYGVVRRTVSSYRRSQRTKLERESSLAAPSISSEPTPLELTERAGELRLLMKLLSGLDDAKREVFLLVELDELTVPEAAEALGIPLNTAYSRLRAARLAFEAALARQAIPSAGALRRCQS
jgi:RNA polymerase sigma-70 factor (ECF subfamily)